MARKISESLRETFVWVMAASGSVPVAVHGLPVRTGSLLPTLCQKLQGKQISVQQNYCAVRQRYGDRHGYHGNKPF
jgi:hypothetical protein